MTELPDKELSLSLATKEENKDKWMDAVNSEIRIFEKNEIWVLVPREKATKVLTAQLLFR